MRHTEYTFNTKTKLIHTIHRLLEPESDLLINIRKIVSYKNEIGNVDGSIFNAFVAFDSETDHWPAGASRLNYSEAALKKIDTEITKFSLQVREEVIREANFLLAKLS